METIEAGNWALVDAAHVQLHKSKPFKQRLFAKKSVGRLIIFVRFLVFIL